jgi:GNAT superfamily N-acetyltransferase
VADEMHGRGLATQLLEQLAEIAASRSITRFDAAVMAGNRPMLGVFAGAGFDIRRKTDYGEVFLSLDLRPTERYEERRADRTHLAAVASLRPLLARCAPSASSRALPPACAWSPIRTSAR